MPREALEAGHDVSQTGLSSRGESWLSRQGPVLAACSLQAWVAGPLLGLECGCWGKTFWACISALSFLPCDLGWSTYLSGPQCGTRVYFISCQPL